MNIHDAKTHFSKLVERVQSGEEIVIARSGQPVARLVPYVEGKPRELGGWEGKLWLAPDWDSDEVNEEIARLFYEGDLPETSA